MTREEAVYYLIKPIVTSTIPADETVKQLEAWSMAVKALDGKFEPKHGRWETPKGYPNVLLCSECNTPYEKKEFVATPNYCPNCGARMDAQIGEDKSHPFAESVMMGMDGGEK